MKRVDEESVSGKGSAIGREALIVMARRTLAHAKAGTMPLAAGHHAVPASRYSDSQRWQLEVERIHRRLPQAMALTSDLPSPGSFETLDPTGIPILIAGGQDGRNRAFRNSCSHRGARLEDRASGTTTRFTCPYHDRSCDGEGRLVGVSNEGDIEPSRPAFLKRGRASGPAATGIVCPSDVYLSGEGLSGAR